jgi:hypothetical protein
MNKGKKKHLCKQNKRELFINHQFKSSNGVSPILFAGSRLYKCPVKLYRRLNLLKQSIRKKKLCWGDITINQG